MKNFIVAALLAVVCCETYGQNLAVSTNVLDYANLATLNVGVSYGFARHWDVGVGLKYNPFDFGGTETGARYRQRSASVKMRYWFWNIYSGFWISGGARGQEYNMGRAGERQTSEGDRFGGGLSAGYSKMLTPHLNLDFGLGVWGGYDRYTVYACRNCGRIVGGGAKYFILPDDILVSLSYIF